MISDPITGAIYRVVDVHQHLAHGEGSERGAPFEPRVEVFDRFGIDQAVLLPPSGAFGSGRLSADTINAGTAEVASRWPERVLGGLAHVDLSDAVAECERTMDQAVTGHGLRGVAWHHRFQGTYLDHPSMPRLLRRCAQLGVPALIHVISGSGLEAVWRLDRLLTECPDTTVCALDAFSSTEQAEEITRLAQRHRNLHCDLGGMISVSGWTIRRFLDAVGSERLLFGTNLYMAPRTWYAPAPLYELLHMDITETDKRRILAENAFALFS